MAHNFKAYAPTDKVSQIRKLAGNIRDQETLDRVLNACDPGKRNGVLKLIWPYLGFTPEVPDDEEDEAELLMRGSTE